MGSICYEVEKNKIIKLFFSQELMEKHWLLQKIYELRNIGRTDLIYKCGKSMAIFF